MRVFHWAGLGAVVGTVIFLALPHHPGYQEWRCRGRSLPELQSLQRSLPESPIVLYYLGQAMHQVGQSAAAAPILQRAAALDGDSIRVREALVAAQLAAGQTRETFDHLRSFLETHPETPEAYQMLGRFLLGVQTYSRAVIVLEEATKRFPSDGISWMLLASTRQQFGDLFEARAAVGRAIALRPNDPEAFVLQARILRDLGEVEARTAYENGLRLAPNDDALKAEFADYLVRRATSPQDLATAINLARGVLQKSPGNRRANGALGLALAGRGQDSEALPLLRQAVEESPRDIPILRALSRIYQKQGNTVEAAQWKTATQRAQETRNREKQLLDALEAKPKDVTTLKEIAQLTGRNGEVARSVRYYAIALNQTPDAAAPLLATARDLHMGGFTDAARQVAERALQNSRSPQERQSIQMFLNNLTP